MVFIDDNYLHEKKYGVKEGGIARNLAWRKWIKKNSNFVSVNLIYCKLFNYLYLSIRLLSMKNKVVFFLYPKVGFPILATGFLGDIFRYYFLKIIDIVSKKNEIIIDISDIKYEQSLDLALNQPSLSKIKIFEEKLFKKNVKFIFASNNMKNYIQKKFKLNESQCDVCINGGNINENSITIKNLINEINMNNNKIKYVYAGTLNKGRMIEKMIDVFPNNGKIILYLLGSEGEWLKDYLKDKDNIKYLGAFEEEVAHAIVKCCDVGLIPYDIEKKYYNIAYPTKLSFYITAGVPYLSTPVDEILYFHDSFNLGFVEQIVFWKDTIDALSLKEIREKKLLVEKNKKFFFWNEIFNDCKFFQIKY